MVPRAAKGIDIIVATVGDLVGLGFKLDQIQVDQPWSRLHPAL